MTRSFEYPNRTSSKRTCPFALHRSTGLTGSGTVGSSSRTPDTFSSAAVADWYEFRKNATSCSGEKKLRTYRTAESRKPSSIAPSATRMPPHAITTARVTEATAIRPGSNVPNRRIERMLTSR
jgi:hypothetical protein